ncbi:MAG TPA: RNA polymerase sigma factor [Candidatus Angelobacter sp.]|nr:RNA polymerase sigma factor [Candidatus Angelobacter sp.]
MNVHVSYKAGKTPEVEREFHNQIQKLRRRLQVFKPDLVHLRAFVEQDGSRRASSSLNLRLPSGQMAAQRYGGNPLAAVKAAFADLLTQVTKHKELLRGHWTQTQRRRPAPPQPGQNLPSLGTPAPRPERELRQAAAAASVVAAKPQPAARVAESGLEGWVNANLSRLEQYVDHELQSRVMAGQIREDQISCEEVVDEAMVSALSQEDHHVGLLSPESWFHRLALQAIRRLIRSNADTGNLSLDAPAGTPNVTGSDENVLQYHQPDDSLPEESVIRDANIRTPEEIFAGEEMVAQLDIVLHEVKTEDREAFVLYTLEGFSVEEISRLAGRPAEDVRKSIQHVRERVQKKLPEENQYRRSLLRRSRVA